MKKLKKLEIIFFKKNCLNKLFTFKGGVIFEKYKLLKDTDFHR